MRGKTWQIPMVVLALLSVAVAPATASKGRVAKATYDFDMTDGGSVWVDDEDVALTSGDAVAFETARTDRVVAVMVMDDSAQAVSAAVWQEGQPATVFCHEIASVPIIGGQPVYVQVMVDANPTTANGCATPEMPTTGTMTVTFNRAPKSKGHQHHH